MAFAPVLGLIGAGVSAFGAIEGGIAQRNSLNYQSQIAKNNAITAGQNSVYAEHAGETQAAQTSLKSAAQQAKIKGSLAANGVDVNSGSAVDVQESAREAGKQDTETTMANANLAAYGYRTQAASFDAQSALDKSAADNAVPGAILGATGGLLSNASAIGMKAPNLGNDLSSLFTSS
jgi:hypothetical protein